MTVVSKKLVSHNILNYRFYRFYRFAVTSVTVVFMVTTISDLGVLPQSRVPWQRLLSMGAKLPPHI